MQFSLTHALQILERTPEVLQAQLSGLSSEWTFVKEDEQAWSVFEIAGHLVYVEKNNWLPRAQIVHSDQREKQFNTLNPQGHLEECKEKSLDDLLREFSGLRKLSIKKLKGLNLDERDFSKTANHPALGTARLDQLLSTWVVHDLSHLAQISRVMAKQYKEAVGPFSRYLKILDVS